MKTTYLVYKQIDGVQRLVPATRAEWDAIMKENRGLSRLSFRITWGGTTI